MCLLCGYEAGMCRMKFQNTEHGIHFSNTEQSKTTELQNTEFFYKLKILICSIRDKIVGIHFVEEKELFFAEKCWKPFKNFEIFYPLGKNLAIFCYLDKNLAIF
jgi:hypothetical protein